MAYEFDELITGHLQKEAFWGAVGRAGAAVARGGASFGKGLFGFGPKAGAGLGGKALNYAGKATMIGAPIAGSITAGQNAGPSVFGLNGSQPGSKYGSVNDTAVAAAIEKYAGFLPRKKVANDYSPLKRAVNVASYGAFALPYLIPKIHDNHTATTALNALGLAGLGATADNNFDRAGLAIMGAGVLKDALGNKPSHG